MNSIFITGRWRVENRHFSELDSTQDWSDAKPDDSFHVFAITADRQTRGRGRGSRQWENGLGNFTGSLILSRPVPEPFALPTLGLLVAISVAESVVQLGIAKSDLRLKWPNDCLVRERKLAGVLLTASKDEVRVGLGVNLATAPILEAGAPRSAISLLECAPSLRGQLNSKVWLETFLPMFLSRYDRWLASDSTSWRDDWWLWTKPNTVDCLRSGDNVRYESLGPGGELLARLDSGELKTLVVEELL